ncbi:MAG TPA: 1-acyl-sn-glycerol-3-phosphate acyltransferase [Actinomycetota bacterium]|nr:1-acyl-sn-glycerol-3-phosphate acyltransferase [Actinomycetota bacterium]
MEHILETPDFLRTLARLSEETGRPVSELTEEARDDLKEMAVKPGGVSVTAWDRFTRWMSRAYQVDYHPQDVEDLRALNERSGLIFLPNHRSYLDPLVLRWALEQHGFPPNNTLGGSNLALWPMSEIGKRNGIVFIRREFRDDHLYRAVLKTYLSHLMENRQNLEWYIEGGRTRTGKLRPPRYGILSYVVDAFADSSENDVHIVPTSIIYDQQHEVSAISAEEMGGTKKAESIGWLYRFARSQSRRLGRAHLRFGEPLSLADAVRLTDDADGNPRPRLAVPKVAFETCNRINAVTPVTPSAMLTFALLDNGDRAITVDEGRRILQPLLDYIRVRNLPLTQQVNLDEHGPLRDTLRNLVQEGVVTQYDGPEERVFYVSLDKQHEAAFYRNTVIHFFINRAITELAAVKAAEDGAPDVKTATWENARRLKDILKFEFFFPSTREFSDQISAESTLMYPGWERDDLTAEGLLAEARQLDLILAHRVIGPFLEAYSVLADELAAAGDQAVEQKELVATCLSLARQRWLQKTLHTPESISKDYFVNAFQLAKNQGLITSDEPDLAGRRKAFADELRDAVRRTDDLRRIAAETGQPLLTERATTGGIDG